MPHTSDKDVSMRAPARSMWRRTVTAGAVFCLCFAGVVVQLGKVQLVQGALWSARATAQQLSEQPISAARGRFFDRTGEVLADSRETVTVVMRPAAIPSEGERARIADELSALLDIDRDTLYARTGKRYSRCETVAAKLELSQGEAFLQWLQGQQLPGVFRIIRDYKRTYPQGNLLSCVLGFTGADGAGLEGLEAGCNEALAGQAGRILLSQNGWGDALPDRLQIEDAVDAIVGNDVVLTVDANIQRITEQYLEQAVRETGATNRGCAIVMDVDTGAILAMATKPDYDLNAPFEAGEFAKAVMLERADEEDQAAVRVQALQSQWKNKAISEFYEPGSVFKTFTAAMGLTLGVVNPNTPFYCRGFHSMPGAAMMKCHVYPRSHGSQTFAEAISHSCNPAFMTLGGMIGGQHFSSFFEAFGFTARTGIDMPGEARVTPSLYHTPEQITALDVATSSIGQTFKVTPIQMITAMCAVANGGKLMQPYVVDRVLSPAGEVLQKTEPTVRRRVMSEQVSAQLCQMLEGVVDGGGAKNAYVAGYRVAGKTGTSVKTDGAVQADGRKNVVASFMGIAPADDPEIAVLVLLDEPQTAIRYGGTLAAPVAQKILEKALPYLGVAPQYTAQQLEQLQRTVPALEGMPLSQAQRLLQQQGLRAQVSGAGDTVLRQSPAAGAAIGTGGCVVLYTEQGAPQQVQVPLLTGLTLQQANTLAASAGLNLIAAGFLQDAGTAYISEQSLSAGSVVAVGSTVTVRLTYRDSVE